MRSLARAAPLLLLLPAWVLPPAAADLSTGLIGHWSFDAASMTDSLVSDLSGNGLDLTRHGGSVGPGRAGQALRLDGNSWLERGYDTRLDLGGDFTITSWVKVDALGANSQVILKKARASSPQRDNYNLFLAPDGSVACSSQDRNGGQGTLVTSAKVAPGTWSFLACRHRGGTLEVWMGGTVVGSRTDSRQASTGPDPLSVGRTAEPAQEYLHGALDDLRLYSRALADGEMVALWGAPVAVIAPVPPLECSAGAAVAILDASFSYDPNGEPLAFSWSAPRGSLATPTASVTEGTFPLGVTAVTVTVRDPQLASSASADVRVVDRVAPRLLLDLAGDRSADGWWRGPVQAQAAADDACDGLPSLQHRLDAGLWTAYAGPFDVTSEGWHNWSVAATDSSGLRTEETMTFRIATPPGPPQNVRASVSVTPSPPDLYISVRWDSPADVGAGIAGYRVQRDSGAGWTTIADLTERVHRDRGCPITGECRYRVLAYGPAEGPASTATPPVRGTGIPELA